MKIHLNLLVQFIFYPKCWCVLLSFYFLLVESLLDSIHFIMQVYFLKVLHSSHKTMLIQAVHLGSIWDRNMYDNRHIHKTSILKDERNHHFFHIHNKALILGPKIINLNGYLKLIFFCHLRWFNWMWLCNKGIYWKNERLIRCILSKICVYMVVFLFSFSLFYWDLLNIWNIIEFIPLNFLYFKF